jgi:hypothetical protein
MSFQYFTEDEIAAITEDNLQEKIHEKLRALGVTTRYDLRVYKQTLGALDIQRDMMGYEGPKCQRSQINLTIPELKNYNFNTIEHEINRVYRKHLRNMYLQSCGITENTIHAPKHCHSMNSLQKAMVYNAGLDPMIFFSEYASKTSFYDYIRERGLKTTGRRWQDGRLQFGSLESSQIEIMIIGRPTLVIRQTLPQSTLIQCAGKYIDEIIDHPAVKIAKRTKITEAHTIDGKTHFTIEDKEEYLGRNITGIKRNWLSVPFNPKPTD